MAVADLGTLVEFEKQTCMTFGGEKLFQDSCSLPKLFFTGSLTNGVELKWQGTMNINSNNEYMHQFWLMTTGH